MVAEFSPSGSLLLPTGIAASPDIRQTAAMLHLLKLSVGIRDIAHLRQVQAARAKADPPLRHRTRNFPRRADEIRAGGSIYWVIAGAIVVRQRVLAIIEDQWQDGAACAGIVLHKTLVPVSGRSIRPFQGWRYLEAAEAPPDVVKGARAKGEEALPPALKRALRALGLL
jgi:hypothetical protein